MAMARLPLDQINTKPLGPQGRYKFQAALTSIEVNDPDLEASRMADDFGN
jgi:hypothetical protein